jgi:hypothetical protein
VTDFLSDAWTWQLTLGNVAVAFTVISVILSVDWQRERRRNRRLVAIETELRTIREKLNGL